MPLLVVNEVHFNAHEVCMYSSERGSWVRLVARWLPSQAAEPLKEYSLHSGDHNTMPLRKKLATQVKCLVMVL